MQSRAKVFQFVESIPVEKRLHQMSVFDSYLKRPTIGRLMTNEYMRYLVSTMFIDVRLLQLLIRFATKSLQKGEKYLKSASGVIEHIRHQYPTEKFDYLTPDYILQWYDLLGGENSNLLGVKNWTDDLTQDASVPVSPPYYLQIPLQKWRKFMHKPRKDLLERTGYEHI